MPIYGYVCEKCGARIEVIQKVGDAPRKRCQKCRGKLEKIVSRTSFQLKGGGWYLTDYSRKAAAVSADKPEKSAAVSADKPEKSAASKAESKSESTTSSDSK